MRNSKKKIIELLPTNKDFSDFKINIDKENLINEGHSLIGKLLNILQVYKSSGSVERAKKFYDDYS